MRLENRSSPGLTSSPRASRSISASTSSDPILLDFFDTFSFRNMVLRDADNSGLSSATRGAWGDLLLEDRGGWVPLPYAVEKGHEAAVRQLLDKGAGGLESLARGQFRRYREAGEVWLHEQLKIKPL